jgi:hypothetical protein
MFSSCINGGVWRCAHTNLILDTCVCFWIMLLWKWYCGLITKDVMFLNLYM